MTTESGNNESRASVPSGPDKYLVIVAKFRLRPGCREAYLALLRSVLVHLGDEASFLQTIVHVNPEDASQIVLYEIWTGTKEGFLAEQLPRPYRRDYLAALPQLTEEVTVDWLAPIIETGTRLLQFT